MRTMVNEESVSDFPIFFRLAPMYRRIGIYLFAGYIFVITTFVYLCDLDVFPNRDGIWVFFLLTSPMLLGALLIFRLLLRVDDKGIWRRRFIGWDLWSWEAFSGGQVKQGPGEVFTYSAKPWSKRYLLLEFLTDDDRKQLTSIIKRFWEPPQMPPIPDELFIRWGFRSWARLTQNAIQIGKGKNDTGNTLSWTAVPQVRITRLDHSRRDFQRVEISSPDSTQPILRLVNYGSPQWKGSDPEIISAFLECVVPTSQLLVTANDGPPRTLAEVDWRISELDRFDLQTKSLPRGIPVMLLFAAICLLLVELLPMRQKPRDLGHWIGMGMLSLWPVSITVMFWLEYVRRTRANNVKRTQLAEWRDQLAHESY